MGKTIILSLLFTFLAGNLYSGNLVTAGFDAELISYQTNITLQRGRLITHRIYEMQINNRAGEDHSSIVIPFSPLRRISNIEAYIKDANGQLIKKLRQNEIKERSAYSSGSFYVDEKEKFFTLKHSTYPYTLVYSYQIAEKEFFSINSWFPILNLNIPTRNAVLNIDLPANYLISYKEQFVDSFSKVNLASRVQYQWQASYNGKMKQENHAPFISGFLPAVFVVPLDFVYHARGSFKSWVDFGNWQSKLLKEASDLPTYEKARLGKIIDGIEGDKEKVEALYRILQRETRYLSVNIETGGLKPYPASYVARNKFGDCKALTNYFKAVLDHVGIPAYYTLVYANEKIRPIDKTFPSQQFNHVILCVPIQNDTLWLDCTSKGPFNYPGTFNQDRDALLIDFNRSQFVKVPAMAATDVLEERTARFTPLNQSQARIDCRVTYRGYHFERLHQMKNLPVNRREQILRMDFSLPGAEQSIINMGEPDMNSAKVELEHKNISSRVFSSYGKDIYIRLLPFPLPSLANYENRALPMQINFPVANNDILEYVIPDGYEIFLPQNREIRTDFGTYSAFFEKRGPVMVVRKELRINPGIYQGEQYMELYKFLENIKLFESKQLMITQNSDLL
jgi:hypothetical protein